LISPTKYFPRVCGNVWLCLTCQPYVYFSALRLTASLPKKALSG